MSRIIVDAVRNSSASSDGITLASDGSVTIPGNATCSGTATGFGGGKLLQVVQTAKTDHYSVTNTTGTDITGMDVTITPASSNSKVLILVELAVGDQGNGYSGFKLIRGSTTIGQSTALDSANVSNTQDTAFGFGSESSQATYKLNNTSFNFLDTPSTTSATTYKVQIVTWTSTTFHLNRPNSVGNARYTMSGTSTITALEIGA